MMNPFIQRIIANSYVPIEFVGSSVAASSATINLASHSSSLAGDLFIAVMTTTSAIAFNPSSSGGSGGDVKINSSGLCVYAGNVAVGGAGGLTVTCQLFSPGSEMTAILLIYRYAKWGGIGSVGTLANSSVAPSITTVDNNSLSLAWYAIQARSAGMTIGTPSGFSLVRSAGAAAPSPALSVFSKLMPSAGATGDATSAIANSGEALGNQFWITPS